MILSWFKSFICLVRGIVFFSVFINVFSRDRSDVVIIPVPFTGKFIRYFSKRIILVPILHRTNCIVIAINSENLGFSESLMLDTAIQLKKKMGINFGQLSQIVAEYNSSFLI